MKNTTVTLLFFLTIISYMQMFQIKKTKIMQPIKDDINKDLILLYLSKLNKRIDAINNFFLRNPSDEKELEHIIEFVRGVEEAEKTNDNAQFEKLSNDYFQYTNIKVNDDGSINAKDLNRAGCDHAKRLLIANDDFPFNAKKFANKDGIIEKKDVITAFTSLCREFDELLDSLNENTRHDLEELFHLKYEIMGICDLKSNNDLIVLLSQTLFENEDKDNNGEIDIYEYTSSMKLAWNEFGLSTEFDDEGKPINFDEIAKKDFLKHSRTRGQSVIEKFLYKEDTHLITRELLDKSCKDLTSYYKKIVAESYRSPACQSPDYE